MSAMSRRLARLRRDDRGAQAIEFALISVPLLWLLYGAVSFGFVLNAQETATQLAREGARAAAICAGAAGCDQQSTVNARVGSAKPNGFTLTSAVVTVPCTSATSGDVTVVVETRPPLYFQPFLNGSTAIRGKATTPCGG